MQHPLVLIGLAMGLVAMLILAAALGLAFAAEDRPPVPPRGTEGPDSRWSGGPHRTGGNGTRCGCPTASPDMGGLDIR